MSEKKDEYGEQDLPCPQCGGLVGHRINCRDGGVFAGEVLRQRKQAAVALSGMGINLEGIMSDKRINELHFFHRPG